jgi:hypothetical protein
MLAMHGKRDNDYYLERLRAANQTLYADVKAGRVTARQALDRAGIKKLPSGLTVLKRAWKKATAREKREFFNWLKSTMPARKALPRPAIIQPDRKLTAHGKAEIERIMSTRKIKTGTLMRELGYNPLNQSIGNALSKGRRILDPKLVEALEKWIDAHRSVLSEAC